MRHGETGDAKLAMRGRRYEARQARRVCGNARLEVRGEIGEAGKACGARLARCKAPSEVSEASEVSGWRCEAGDARLVMRG